MKPKDYRQTDPCCMDQEAHMMEGWGEDKEVLLKKKKHQNYENKTKYKTLEGTYTNKGS